AAGRDAGAAGDAAGGVDEDGALVAHALGPLGSVGEAGTVVGGAGVLGATATRSEAVVASPGTGGREGSGAGPSTRDRRHAAVLNAGIQDVGSKREIVSVLAATGEAQWYGMNTVSGRIVATTLAGSTDSPRRDSTRTLSPSRMPSAAAVLGWTSTHRRGACSTR